MTPEMAVGQATLTLSRTRRNGVFYLLHLTHSGVYTVHKVVPEAAVVSNYRSGEMHIWSANRCVCVCINY